MSKTAVFRSKGEISSGRYREFSDFRKNQLGYSQYVEKRTPHCKLAVVRALVEAGRVKLLKVLDRHPDLLGEVKSS